MTAIYEKVTSSRIQRSQARAVSRGTVKIGVMTINNFDQRVKGNFSVPRERWEYVKDLDRRLKESRAKKPKAKPAG